MNKITSSDEYPAREEDAPTDPIVPLSTKQKIMNKAFYNKEFIAIVCAALYYVATQFIVQPYVDAAQDNRMKQIEKDVGEIKGDVKSLLHRAKL